MTEQQQEWTSHPHGHIGELVDMLLLALKNYEYRETTRNEIHERCGRITLFQVQVATKGFMHNPGGYINKYDSLIRLLGRNGYWDSFNLLHKRFPAYANYELIGR